MHWPFTVHNLSKKVIIFKSKHITKCIEKIPKSIEYFNIIYNNDRIILLTQPKTFYDEIWLIMRFSDEHYDKSIEYTIKDRTVRKLSV